MTHLTKGRKLEKCRQSNKVKINIYILRDSACGKYKEGKRITKWKTIIPNDTNTHNFPHINSQTHTHTHTHIHTHLLFLHKYLPIF